MAATLPTDTTRPASRLVFLDVARGVAILAMIGYHLGWDLSALRLITTDVAADPAWRVFARLIAGTFIGISGINLVMATRRGFRLRPFLTRLAIIIAAALAVSAGTYWFAPQTFVFFGILHCIALASVLALPFLYLPSWAAALAAALCLVAPSLVSSPIFDAPGWYWLGLSTAVPATVDYVPILPWFGVTLIGIIIGRLLVRHPTGRLPQWRGQARWARALAVTGRWSLVIYLVHQPILMGALSLAAPWF